MIARVTSAGDAVRIRLDNTFGAAPLVIGHAYAGLRVQGAMLAAGSNRPVLFRGQSTTTIPAGGSVVSDPVALTVAAWQDVAVSLFLPGTSIQPSQHTGAVVTSYLTADHAGDQSANDARTPFVANTTSTYWLKAIDVLSPASPGTVVAFGDSITDGTCSTLDAHDRWENWLWLRLRMSALSAGAVGAVPALINEGIGGNTVTRDGLQPPPDSPPALERLDRDVLSHSGVTTAVVFVGTNDIRRGAPARAVIAGLTTIIGRLKARQIRTIGVTIIPRHNVAPSGTNTGWDPAKTVIRRAVNDWIRTQAPFDAVIDFDAVVRDAADPDRIAPAFDCGDGIHPSPAGYFAMGQSIPLNVLR